jgi:hypothetical protein
MDSTHSSAGGAGKAALSGGVLAAALRRTGAAGRAPGAGPIDSSDEEDDDEGDEFDQELRARTLSALTATTSGRAPRPAPVPSLAAKSKGKGREEDGAAGQVRQGRVLVQISGCTGAAFLSCFCWGACQS